MSYTPTQWTTGDTITASALNKIEQGIANAGSALIVDFNADDDELNKTWAEIYTAIKSGTPVYIRGVFEAEYDFAYSTSLLPVIMAYKYDTEYRVFVLGDFQGGMQSISGVSGLLVPTVVVFHASSASGTLTWYKRVRPQTSVST